MRWCFVTRLAREERGEEDSRGGKLIHHWTNSVPATSVPAAKAGWALVIGTQRNVNAQVAMENNQPRLLNDDRRMERNSMECCGINGMSKQMVKVTSFRWRFEEMQKCLSGAQRICLCERVIYAFLGQARRVIQ